GAQSARRIVPGGVRGPEPVPPGEPVSGLPLEPLRAALRRDGEGARVRGRHRRAMDAHACLRDLLRLLAPVTPFSSDKMWRSVYGGSVHAERFPAPRDGIPASRADFTDGLLAFNADVWKRKRDQGLSLNVELPGVEIPPGLKPFEGDLRRMHRLV